MLRGVYGGDRFWEIYELNPFIHPITGEPIDIDYFLENEPTPWLFEMSKIWDRACKCTARPYGAGPYAVALPCPIASACPAAPPG
jgi:hypothetical protein